MLNNCRLANYYKEKNTDAKHSLQTISNKVIVVGERTWLRCHHLCHVITKEEFIQESER